ncbi:hypothetical protein [Lacrimispora brassicae]
MIKTKKFLEFLSYNLVSGKGNEFHQLEKLECIPLHQKFCIDVVAFGQSVENPDVYYLIRAFDSLEECEKSLQQFYKSVDWINGPRTSILSIIENSTNVKIWVDYTLVDLLRML